MRRIALALVLVVTLAGCKSSHTSLPPSPPPSSPSASTSYGPVPSYLLDPDVTQATIATTICVAGWTDTVRPPSSYTTGLKCRQLPAGADLAGYEEDHWIPLELGGSPREPRCRCTTCRPDLHVTHPDTLACERNGCRPADGGSGGELDVRRSRAGPADRRTDLRCHPPDRSTRHERPRAGPVIAIDLALLLPAMGAH